MSENGWAAEVAACDEALLTQRQERIVALETQCALSAASLRKADERIRQLEAALRHLADAADRGAPDWDIADSARAALKQST